MNSPDGTDDRSALRALHRASEDSVLVSLLEAATLPPELDARVIARARALIRAARADRTPGADIADFLQEYGLNTREGVSLLSLAEALLRIPDAATAEAFIEDRIATLDWRSHLGHADSFAVNASSWAFMLTGRVLAPGDTADGGFGDAIRRMLRRLGEPVILTALRQGIRILARQFVMGRTIEDALVRTGTGTARRWRYSFDMLGEAARTRADAAQYMTAYKNAIAAVGRVGGGPVAGPGISVKLSALHPRYEPLQAARCVPDLIAALTVLALDAKAADIGVTVDAEEADRLEISLDIFSAVLADPGLRGWDGLGVLDRMRATDARPARRLAPGLRHA